MSPAWTGGALLFSDSPESPSTPGILYDDATLTATPAGVANRVYLYHSNGTSSLGLQFGAVLTNLGAFAGSLTVSRSGTAGPTTAYAYAGKIAVERWLQSNAQPSISVAAGATVEFDTTFDSITTTSAQLMHGIWDYSFDQPHRITFCALTAGTSFTTGCTSAAILPRDGHDRGTFASAEETYDSAPGVVIDTAAGIAWLPLASGTGSDPYENGIDATDGSAATLGGNYGVLYRVHLATQATDGARLALMLNPRGGAWGGAVNTEGGLTSGGIFLVPAGTALLGDPTMAVFSTAYAPGPGLDIWIQFMPAGGSSFPVDAVLVPF